MVSPPHRRQGFARQVNAAANQEEQDSTTQVHFNAAGAAGGAITAMAASAASAPPKPAPTAAPNSSDKDDPRNKETYKVTAKDLEEMEKKSVDKDLEMPLRHHWTNFSFYLMASLSIVLPVLFLSKSCSLSRTVMVRLIEYN